MMKQINSLVPELWCSDFDKSLNFYINVLGFAVVQRRDQSHHAYLELEGAQIMLASWEQDGTWETGAFEKPFGRGINFQVLVENAQGLHERVLANEVHPFVEIHTKEYWRTGRMDTRKEFAVLDPDGYLLRFTQIISHRPITQTDLDELDSGD